MKYLVFTWLFLYPFFSLGQKNEYNECNCSNSEICYILNYLYNNDFNKLEKVYTDPTQNFEEKYKDFPLIMNLLSAVKWRNDSYSFFNKAQTIFENYCNNQPGIIRVEFEVFINEGVLKKSFLWFIRKDKYESECIPKIFENIKYFGNCRDFIMELDTCKIRRDHLLIEIDSLKKDTLKLGKKVREANSFLEKFELLDSTYRAAENLLINSIKMDSSNNNILGIFIDQKSFNKFATNFIKDSIDKKNNEINNLKKVINGMKHDLNEIERLRSRNKSLRNDSINNLNCIQLKAKLENDKKELVTDTLRNNKKINELIHNSKESQKIIEEQNNAISSLTRNISTIKLGVQIDEKKLKNVFRIDTIYFNKRKYNILPKYYSKLDSIFSKINENEEVIIYIYGYADSEGDDEYNLRLSELRAKSVFLYFNKKGVPINKIYLNDFGEIDKNKNNRRVEIYLLK